MNIILRTAIFFLLAGLALFSVAFAAEDPLAYKGLRVPPEPPGHEDLGGYLINPGAATEYAVTQVQFGNRKMWWLKKMVSRDAQGRAHWEVAAVTTIPRIPNSYYFLMGLCEKDGVAMPEIIAAAKSENKERLDKIHSVWFVNLKTHRFEPYSTKGIVCINEGFGV